MKKFVLLHYGFTMPTQEIMEAWGKWFQSLGDCVVDMGNPFREGREITSEGTKDLPLNMDSVTGYTMINAQNMDEAEKIAKTCPFIAGIRVYEATAM